MPCVDCVNEEVIDFSNVDFHLFDVSHGVNAWLTRIPSVSRLHQQFTE